MSLALASADHEPEPLVEAAAFVLALRARGISDLRLLRAMETVRREVFAPRRYADLARQDVALPLPSGQTMTAPVTVALMLAALAPAEGHRVLEIGTGSGYATALLRLLAGRVRSHEIRPVLRDSAWQRLRAAGFSDGCDLNGEDGLASGGGEVRYDRILLNGAFPDGGVPAAVTSRLAEGGRLVAGAEGERGAAKVLVIERGAGGDLTSRLGARIRLPRFS